MEPIKTLRPGRKKRKGNYRGRTPNRLGAEYQRKCPVMSDVLRKEWDPVDDCLGRPEVEATWFFGLYMRGLSNGLPSYSLEQLREDIAPGACSKITVRNFRMEVLQRFNELVWASQKQAGAA